MHIVSLATILHPLDVLGAQLLPAAQKTNQRSEAESGRRDGKDGLQASDVPIDDDGDLLRGERCADLGGAGGKGEARVELWEVLDKVGDELVVEATLGGGDEERAADG
jgi:hypothetical protein